MTGSARLRTIKDWRREPVPAPDVLLSDGERMTDAEIAIGIALDSHKFGYSKISGAAREKLEAAFDKAKARLANAATEQK